jgi:hypothetical protein
MLCSEVELGLGSDNETLLRLSDDAVPGTPLIDALGLDVPAGVANSHADIFEIGLTPDRGDCLSHYGVARELAAALGTTMKTIDAEDLSNVPKADFVSIENSNDCPRYMGIQIENVVVGPSPAWLRRAVEAGGARSINNVVDVTNWICFELGHPMHAFDADKLAEKRIAVRRAKAGEKILAINHETYDLCENDVVITDGFSGNIFLKSSEGTALAIMARFKEKLQEGLKAKLGALLAYSKIRELKELFDYADVGGAPILGLKGAVLKIHGNSGEKEVYYAIIKAIPYIRNNVTQMIADAVTQNEELFKTDSSEE